MRSRYEFDYSLNEVDMTTIKEIFFKDGLGGRERRGEVLEGR